MSAEPRAAADKPQDDVGLSIVDGIATVTLNRPQARNALSVAMLRTLDGIFEGLDGDARVRVVVVESTGPVFCSGHDLKELRARPDDEAFYQEVFALSATLMQRIVGLSRPVIAKLRGAATAAGSQLISSCDLVFASEEASVGTPGVNIGLFCSTPMVALSRAVGRKHAMQMLLTGEPVTAARAMEMGLVNEVLPADALDDRVAGIARLIASKSPKSLEIGKEAFYRQAEMPLAEAYEYAAAVMARNMLAEDAKEGIQAFIDKRSPNWTGK